MLALKQKYNDSIKTELKEELSIGNVMNVPKLDKIVISVGLGNDSKDTKYIQNVEDTITLIAGQKAVTTVAKKSVAGFKLREGMNSGVKVTLRGDQAYNFLEKMISIAAPRIKDFRGFNENGFDGRGSYNFGLTEQLVFPEVSYDDIIRIHGMNITVVTTSTSDAHAFALLNKFGFPFRKKGE
jgi:large subunit ribosomal protein L5